MIKKLITISVIVIAVYLTYQIETSKQIVRQLRDDYRRTEWVKAAQEANDTTDTIKIKEYTMNN